LAWAALIGAAVTHGIPMDVYKRAEAVFQRVPVYARAAAFIALALLARQVASVEVRPYIYFQF
jgi:hypothetical protein